MRRTWTMTMAAGVLGMALLPAITSGRPLDAKQAQKQPANPSGGRPSGGGKVTGPNANQANVPPNQPSTNIIFDQKQKPGNGAGAAGGLGKLSEREESGGRGPGTVSTGKGDLGGVSYGTYQLSSKVGTAGQFVNRFYSKEFAGLKPGSAEFTKKWKELANSPRTRDQLKANEHKFIKETHHDPLVRKIKKDVGLDVNSRSRTLQDVIWSTAVQHGPGTNLVSKALTALQKTTPLAKATDEAIIKAIYKERGRTNGSGVPVYFTGSSKDQQQAAIKRFQREQKAALEALTAERRAAKK